MKFNETRIWKTMAAVGIVLASVCLAVSCLQYYLQKQDMEFSADKYVGIIINVVFFFGFTYLNFEPMNWWVYAIVFYIYGCGNLIDDGNILGTFCIFSSFVFLYFKNFFKKKKIPKLICFLLLPLLCFFHQCHKLETVNWLVSLMHIIGMIFLLSTILFLVYPHFTRNMLDDKIKYLSREDFSQQDIEWLTKVAAGAKYIQIAKDARVSESKVKLQMLELYKKLELKNRVAFLTVYSGYKFEFSESIRGK